MISPGVHRTVAGGAALVTLLIVVLLIASAGAVAATPVESCDTEMNESGSYELPEDITAQSVNGTCLTVTAGNVTLDGNGHSIVGLDENEGPGHINGSTGIHVAGEADDRLSNVTIRNVTVAGGNHGINATYAPDLTLEDVTVERSDVLGVSARTTGNITLENLDLTQDDLDSNITTEAAMEIGGGVGAPPHSNPVDPSRLTVSNLTVDMSGNLATTANWGVDIRANGPVSVVDASMASYGSGIDIFTDEHVSPSLDETVTLEDIDIVGIDGAGAVYVSSEAGIDATDVQVADHTQSSTAVTGSVHLEGDDAVTLANASVRNVDGEALYVHGTETEVHDVLVENTTEWGLEAIGLSTLDVRNATILETSQLPTPGWAGRLSSQDLTVRELDINDTYGEGLRAVGGEHDVANVSITNVADEAQSPDYGLTIAAHEGSYRNIQVHESSGPAESPYDRESAIRILEDDPAAIGDEVLALENVSVEETSGHGIDAYGNQLAFNDTVVDGAAKTGIRKQPITEVRPQLPEPTSGTLELNSVSITDTGSDGLALLPDASREPQTENDDIQATDVDVQHAGGDGIRLDTVTTASLSDVAVSNATDTDVNLTRTESSLDAVSLDGTTVEGTGTNVTVTAVEQTPALPSGTDHVDAFLEITETTTDGALDGSVHYEDGAVPAGVDESTLGLWRSDGTRWSALNSTVDTAANTVTSDLTYLSTIGALGHQSGQSPVNLTVDIASVNESTEAGEQLSAEVAITNTDTASVTETIELLDFDGAVVDSESVTVDGNGSTTVTLEWTPDFDDVGRDEIAVRGQHGWDTATVDVLVPLTELTDCTAITEQGRYELTANLSYVSGDACLDVQTSRVTIDGQGHAIEGLGDGAAIRVNQDEGFEEELTVENLSVEGVEYGVQAWIPGNVSGLHVTDVQTADVSTAAIEVDIESFFGGLSGLTVEDSTLRTADGGDGITLGAYDDATFEDIAVRDTAINASTGIDVGLDYVGATAQGIEVTNSSVTTASRGVTIEASQTDTAVSDLRLANTTVDAENVGTMLRNTGSGATFEDIRVQAANVTSETGDGLVFEAGGDGSTSNVTIAESRLSGFGSGLDVTADGDQVVLDRLAVRNNSIDDVMTGMAIDLGGGFDQSPIFNVSLDGNDITGFDNAGITLEETLMGANTSVAVQSNTIENEFVDARGIDLRTAGDGSPDNGTLEIADNLVRTGGDAIVINDVSSLMTPGPVNSVSITENALEAPGFGVQNHNNETHGQGDPVVNATNNFWGAEAGPSSEGPYTDPRTGTPADGNGSAASNGSSPSEANVRFDPWLETSPIDGGDDGPGSATVIIENTSAPVAASDPLWVTATVENTGSTTLDRTVTLSVDGVEHNQTTVTLSGGETRSVTLTWATNATDTGNRTATVSTGDDSDATTVTVTAPPIELADFTVTADDPIVRGEPLTVTLTDAINAAGTPINDTAELQFDRPSMTEPLVANLTVSQGNASQVVLSGNETASLSTGTYTDLGVEHVDEPSVNDTYDVTIIDEPTYELLVPDDGNVHTIGFPGPIEGSLADAFPEGYGGIQSIFAYDGSSWELLSGDALETAPNSLEAIVVTTSGAGNDTPVEVALGRSTAAGDRTVGPGWSFVSGTAFTDAEASFGTSSALLVLDRYDGVTHTDSVPTVDAFSSYVIGGTGWSGSAPTLDPFTGYFVYYESPETIAPAVSNVSSKQEADQALGIE